MATYTADQIAQYAYNAGFRGTALVQATAVALAESGGKSDAVSSDGYGSHGLWQFIPSTWSSVTNTPFVNADDPQKNANAAFKLYNQNGKTFSGQWSTWPGAATPHLAAATAAAAKAKDGGDTGPEVILGAGKVDTGIVSTIANGVKGVTDAVNPLNWVKDFVTAIVTPVLNFLIDLGMVAGGGALVFVGIFFITKEMASS